jgi:hypothetical protein
MNNNEIGLASANVHPLFPCSAGRCAFGIGKSFSRCVVHMARYAQAWLLIGQCLHRLMFLVVHLSMPSIDPGFTESTYLPQEAPVIFDRGFESALGLIDINLCRHPYVAAFTLSP